MKILGIGVDIVENKRIQKSIKNVLFIKRIYTSKELKQSKGVVNKVGYFSKRFAAKEAFSKALGTGFRKNLNLKDISIKNNKLGKPEITIKQLTDSTLNYIRENPDSLNKYSTNLIADSLAKNYPCN